MFNTQKIGIPVAKVIDGPDHNVKLYMNNDPNINVKNSTNLVKLKAGKFQQLLNPEIERSIFYIFGPSGSGKTTYTKNIISEWKKMNKKNRDVYVFSALKKDESLDSIKPKRIKIDDSLVDDPIDIELFENSMVIFDDTTCIKNKSHCSEVLKLLDEILETGRHFKISVIMTNHLPTAGKDTKRILNECNYVTYFPYSGSKRQTNYLLIEYLGLDKHQIKAIKKTKSRWATISKNYPLYAITETKIFSLDDESSDDE